jgi:hypothetical protein
MVQVSRRGLGELSWPASGLIWAKSTLTPCHLRHLPQMNGATLAQTLGHEGAAAKPGTGTYLVFGGFSRDRGNRVAAGPATIYDTRNKILQQFAQ